MGSMNKFPLKWKATTPHISLKRHFIGLNRTQIDPSSYIFTNGPHAPYRAPLKDISQVLMAFNSDHGDEHAIKDYTNNEAGPAYVGSMFDHVGTLLYNDVLRVPLMISIPKHAPKNSEALVSGLDIAPTILELFGQTKANWCDGISLFSEENVAKRTIVGAEGYDQRAIFYKQRFKYTKSYVLSNNTCS